MEKLRFVKSFSSFLVFLTFILGLYFFYSKDNDHKSSREEGLPVKKELTKKTYSRPSPKKQTNQNTALLPKRTEFQCSHLKRSTSLKDIANQLGFSHYKQHHLWTNFFITLRGDQDRVVRFDPQTDQYTIVKKRPSGFPVAIEMEQEQIKELLNQAKKEARIHSEAKTYLLEDQKQKAVFEVDEQGTFNIELNSKKICL